MAQGQDESRTKGDNRHKWSGGWSGTGKFNGAVNIPGRAKDAGDCDCYRANPGSGIFRENVGKIKDRTDKTDQQSDYVAADSEKRAVFGFPFQIFPISCQPDVDHAGDYRGEQKHENQKEKHKASF